MKKFFNHTIIKLPILILISLLIVVSFNSCKKKEEPETIKIGAILPLTGPSASLGNWFKIGYILAEEKINEEFTNKKVNMRFKVILEDGKGEQTTSISAYQKLRQLENIKFLSTTLSPITLAIKPIAIKDNLILFGNAAHPKITGDSPLVFRHSNTVEQEGAIIVDFIKNLKPNYKILILASNDDFGLALNDFLKINLSSKNILSELYERNETNFRPIIIKSLQFRPDIIIVIGFVKSMGLAIRVIREMGFTGTIVSNFGFTDPNVIQLAGSAAKGVYYVDYDYDYSKEPLVTLNKLSKEKFGTEFPPVGLLAYNTMLILKDAIENVGSNDVQKISEYIRKKSTFFIGDIKIVVTPKGDILPPLKVKRYE